MVNNMKTWCLSIVFLFHKNASVYLVFLNVFYSFPVRANATFSKRFHTESLTVRAMKTCCSSIVFLVYGNESEQLALFTWMLFCSFRERTSTARKHDIRRFSSFPMETLMNSLFSGTPWQQMFIDRDHYFLLSILLHENANGQLKDI